MTLAIGNALLATIAWIALIVGLWLICRLFLKASEQTGGNRAEAFRDQHFSPVHTDGDSL